MNNKVIIPVIICLIILAIVILIIFVFKPWSKDKSGNNNDQEFLPQNNYFSQLPDPAPNIPKPPEKLKRIKINSESIDNILFEGMNKTISLNKTHIYELSVYKNYNNIHEYSILLLAKYLNNEESEIENDTLRYLENSEENLSLCLFNITNDNIILSIKCPYYFNESQKSEIISDLNLNNIIDFLNIGNNIYINLGNKIDSCGYNCLYETYIINNNDNSVYGIYWENRTISNKNIYRTKKILHINYNLIDKNENYYKEDIKEINFDNIEKKNINENIDISNSQDDDEDNYNEIILFNEEIPTAKISLKNRIEYKDGDLKAYLILKINNFQKNFDDYLNKSLELNEIQKYKSEINEIKKLGNKLLQNISNSYENIADDISNNFNDLNKEIYERNIKEVLDSINENKSDPQNFKIELINSTNKLLESLNRISEDINPYIDEINKNISIYTEDLIQLINQISGNLKELKDELNSQNNIETKIANYYLNNTSSFCFDIIQKVNNIFTNYYNYEKDSINNEIKEMNKKLNFREIENIINESFKFSNLFKYDEL